MVKKQEETNNEKELIKEQKEASRKKEAKKHAHDDNVVRNEFGETIKENNIKTETKEQMKLVKQRQRGKKILKAKLSLEKKVYTISEAIDLLKKIKFSKINESLDLHINVNKMSLKGEVDMPYSIGKKVRVAIADDTVLANLDQGIIDFDILVTTPAYMTKLAKYARLLGPKGLMPSPKTGTISEDPKTLSEKLQGNLLKWKAEPKFPLVHQTVGKLSSHTKELEENIIAFVNSVGKQNISSIYISGTMTPGVKVAIEG